MLIIWKKWCNDLYILDKLLEGRAVIVRTAVTVINIELTVQKIVVLCILFQHGFLLFP